MTTQSCRNPALTVAKPEIEFARIMYGGNGKVVLSIVADGKSIMFDMNRRRLMIFLESGFETLKAMEPGS